MKNLLLAALLACSLFGAKLKVVTTINYFDDMLANVAGDKIEHQALMGEGVDPHGYSPTPSDVTKIQSANVVVYGGLHLEAKMGELFEDLGKKGKVKTIDLSEALDKNTLLKEGDEFDPHVWFDTNNWAAEATYLAKKLGEFDPENKATYEANAAKYAQEVKELETYIKDRFASIPEGSRYLVTVHDAFSYFARQFGLEVKPIMGISTDAQTSLREISELAGFIAEHKVKAIFVENIASSKATEALQEATKKKGWEVKIGRELYSDSMGNKSEGTETYIKTMKFNADAIADALK